MRAYDSGRAAERPSGVLTRPCARVYNTVRRETRGIVFEDPLPTYPNGFPKEIVARFEEETGRKVIGNKPASGTRIIEELGPKQEESGAWILYTSADSVFQLAAHTKVIPLEEL